MLLSQISSFFSPPVESSFRKYSPKTKVSLFGISYEKNKLRLCSSVKLGVKYDGYTYLTSPHHTLESELPLQVESSGNGGGIGIDNFFQGKNIFVTGATGLLGKVLVEKLLRSTSVGKIFILVKANDKEAALDRLSKEITDSELFECIREKHGSSYEEFVRAKLIPVVGNICEPNMGMDVYSANAIMEEVDVIIGSAANTILNDRYDFLLDANVNAPQRLMRFAKRCNNLKLFVHFSTAYVNGRREGIIYEKPCTMGEHGRNCNDNDEKSSSLFPWLDVTDEMNLAMKSCIASRNHDATKDLKRLGRERATYYGWDHAYTMTKSLGEMVLNEIREDIPVLIMRPSIIESCYKEPLPGWIQGNRVFDPVIISYGKGHLPAYFANPQVVMDFIPVDIVANTTIAAIAKHGNIHKPQLNVYHVGSSVTNPIRLCDAFDYLYEYFNAKPLVESQNIARIKFFKKFDDFSKYTREEIFRHNRLRDTVGEDERMIRRIQNQCNAKVAYAEQLCKIYEFAGFFNARFHTGNTQKLIEEMSKEEQINFEVDARNIDWKKYFQEIHVPGLRNYVI